jgi:hypothetical protein
MALSESEGALTEAFREHREQNVSETASNQRPEQEEQQIALNGTSSHCHDRVRDRRNGPNDRQGKRIIAKAIDHGVKFRFHTGSEEGEEELDKVRCCHVRKETTEDRGNERYNNSHDRPTPVSKEVRE